MSVDLSKYIKSIKIESAFLPEIYLDDPFKPGPPNPILQLLKPQITINTSLGEQKIAPYGEPGASIWPVVKTALLIAGISFVIRRFIR